MHAPWASEVEQCVPLNAFIDETMALLEAQPDATEILVDAVRFLRFSAVENRYYTTVAAINSFAAN
ncbi:hypothetical protein ACL9RL_18975 [Plantibacter sp. Mn2098]|uniref:hypothetical protein n=1 Tax=Plantibacter sp. Mn2098 TaxID=3395266 RepID=UPI003BC3AE3F